MNTQDKISILHSLALQIAGKARQQDILSYTQNIAYQELSSFLDLKDSLASLDASEEMFPIEQDWNKAIEIFEESQKLGINIFHISDKSYPSCLRAISNPPVLLHTRGDQTLLNKLPGIAVVGARKATENGQLIAERLSEYLAKNNWVVVSGLALGIDASAHKGALKSGQRGSTIAVLANGLNVAKPASNARLAQEIIDNGGLWVSEHRIGVPPLKNHFVPRNRIQLGLSAGSIIVEATQKSGSITQARFCAEQRRPLFAVMPYRDTNELNLMYEGCEYIVKEMGAIPLRSKHDYPSLIQRLMFQKDLLAAAS